MARWSRLHPTLVIHIDDKESIDDKDRDEDANDAIALAVSIGNEGVGRRYGPLGRETGQGGLALSLLTDPLFPPFYPH